MPLPLIVSDDCCVGRIIADKSSIAVGPSAASFNPLLDRPRRNESNFLSQKIWSQGAQRRDVVHDPDAAAMCRQNKIVITRMNCQVANSNSGKMGALKLCPVCPAVDGDPKS